MEQYWSSLRFQASGWGPVLSFSLPFSSLIPLSEERANASRAIYKWGKRGVHREVLLRKEV